MDEILQSLDELPEEEESTPVALPRSFSPAEQERLQLLFNRQMRRCLILTPEMKDSDLIVRLRIYLREDGSLAQEPMIMDAPAEMARHRLFAPLAAAAVRAVRGCTPFVIPEELRAADFIFNIIPGEVPSR